MEHRSRAPLSHAVAPVTAAACALCLIVFLGISLQGDGAQWEDVSRWGYLPPGAIWEGAYWSLLSSAFVHVEIWHLAFNVYWLWMLGSALERELGAGRFLAFFVASAFVSSAAQLATGDQGIGMSGVVYAMFGFAWVARERMPAFKEVLSEQTITVFLVWLVGCIAATMLGIIAIGNEAHLGGLTFGAAVAAAFVLRWRLPVMIPALALLLALSCIPLFWCPLSSDWAAHQASRAQERGDLPSAIHWYRQSLRLGGDAAWAWYNLAEVYAYRHDKAQYAEALRQMRKVDEKGAREIEARYGATGTAKKPSR
jgi:membrane associated rhomboid family serine protease